MKKFSTRFPIYAAVTLALVAGCREEETERVFIASDRPAAYIYSKADDGTMTVCDSMARGCSLEVIKDIREKSDGLRYVALSDKKSKRYIREANVTGDSAKVVLETTVWTRTPASVLKDTTGVGIGGFASKGEELQVLGYDRLLPDGRVYRYKVSFLGNEGYIYSKYTAFTIDDALYRDAVQDSIHSKIRNPFGGGKASGCDWFPVEKPAFKDNVMPQPCYCLYLNNGWGILNNIESYIEFAKTTKINAFVIDIKDNERPGYRADAMKKYSPTNYSRANRDGIKQYGYIVRRLHEEGFYVIGRITCFKDTYFVKDNPSSAISEISTGDPFFHNKAYWPSAFDRKVWEFNVELACESIRRFGFDEINFDYVRFPDRMTSVEHLVNYHNRYEESKVQAIQRFVAYACDAIHEEGAYVSIDVFGESANGGYTTAYGQYWPALSNVADVMCGMPYPDHFANGFYGISKPWNHPYETLYEWGKRVVEKQKVTPSPAKVRTWVQSYHVMHHVDPDGIDYNAPNVEKEIRALFDNGLDGGYMPWHASSTLERYKLLAPAFSIDYAALENQENSLSLHDF